MNCLFPSSSWARDRSDLKFILSFKAKQLPPNTGTSCMGFASLLPGEVGSLLFIATNLYWALISYLPYFSPLQKFLLITWKCEKARQTKDRMMRERKENKVAVIIGYFGIALLRAWVIHSGAVASVDGTSCLPGSSFFTDFYRWNNRMGYKVRVKGRWCKGCVDVGTYWEWKCLGGNGRKGWVRLLSVNTGKGSLWERVNWEGCWRWRQKDCVCGEVFQVGTIQMKMREDHRQWRGRSRSRPQCKWVE